MKKDKLWRIYIKNNPHWETENITLTPGGLNKFFSEVFDHGHKLGLINGRALEQRRDKENYNNPKLPDDVNGMPSFLKDTFSGGVK